MEPRPESAQESPTMADTAAEFLSLIGACPLQPPPCPRHIVPGEM